jgi:hypothetical protein
VRQASSNCLQRNILIEISEHYGDKGSGRHRRTVEQIANFHALPGSIFILDTNAAIFSVPPPANFVEGGGLPLPFQGEARLAVSAVSTHKPPCLSRSVSRDINFGTSPRYKSFISTRYKPAALSVARRAPIPWSAVACH